MIATTVSVMERARRYLAQIPGAVSGAGGHKQTFHVACVLVQGFGLDSADALELMLEWNATCDPPWSEADLRHKLADAASKGGRTGYLLDGDALQKRAIPSAPLKRDKPDGAFLRKGTMAELKALAKARPYRLEGLLWASERGVLKFGDWHNHHAYAVTDSSGRAIELRRVDGKPFPAHGSLGERKSHALAGSIKRWPVGIADIANAPSIALVEGVPDFLTAHYIALWEQASDNVKHDASCVPVAMLSSAPAIAEEALPLFAGKRVRIFPHSDEAGLRGAQRWQSQLRSVATKVDLFDLSKLKRKDGNRVGDLWEFEHELEPSLWSIPALGKVMP